MSQTPATHRATATGRTVRHYGLTAPLYEVRETAPLAGHTDVVELPDGTHAYLLDFGGRWALYRRRVARLYGSSGELNSRTAPADCTGLLGEVPSCDRALRASGADLIGFADLVSEPPIACSCGAVHDWAAWQQLELLGPVDPELLDPGVVAEQRNCGGCGSTLTAVVECPSCSPQRERPCHPGCECFCHT